MYAILNKTISLVLAFAIAMYPSVCYAEESSPVPVKQGEPAPFNGVLIPTLKAAEMTVRLQQADDMCKVKTKSEVDLAINREKLLLNNCLDTKKINQEMFKSQLSAHKSYSEYLEKQVSSPKLSSEWVFVIGVIAGVGLTIGAAYSMSELSR